MKKPVCEHCGEYTHCICTFEKCALCKKSYSNFDSNDEHQIFEYRGVLGCTKCIGEVRARREFQRENVMQGIDRSVRSQLDGQWRKGGYKTMKIDPHTGRPLGEVKEPLILKDYEDGKF